MVVGGLIGGAVVVQGVLNGGAVVVNEEQGFFSLVLLGRVVLLFLDLSSSPRSLSLPNHHESLLADTWVALTQHSLCWQNSPSHFVAAAFGTREMFCPMHGKLAQVAAAAGAGAAVVFGGVYPTAFSMIG